MAKCFAGGHLRYVDGEWRDDDGRVVDAVEVVRCRYCKHFIGGKAIGKCYLNPDKPIIPVFYNHFCSYGERRDDSGSGA